MEKVKLFITNHFWKVTTVIFFLFFLADGCTNRKISALEKEYSKNISELNLKIDLLTNHVKNTPSKKEVRDEMEVIMFNFLIYEDDLDKGKVSLSDVKNKIESND
jgi:hypothetical protein